MKTKSNAEIRACFDDYKPDDSIFCEDSYLISQLKIQIEKLNNTDKTIILMLAELGSQSEVARRLKISPATMSRKIASIRHKICEKLIQ